MPMLTKQKKRYNVMIHLDLIVEKPPKTIESFPSGKGEIGD